MTRRFFLLLALSSASRIFASAPSNDTATLRYFLSRSELVVIGRITTDFIVGSGHGPVAIPGVKQLTTTDYVVRIEIQEVLSGTPPPEKSILAEIHLRWVHYEPRLFQLKKDGKYLFFLSRRSKEGSLTENGEAVVWEGSDLWFGVMPYDPALAETLRKMHKS